MTLDYISWLIIHKDSSAHKWKKNLNLSYPVKGWTLFPPSNYSAPGCHKHHTCPHVVIPDHPQHKDLLAFIAQITHVPFRELMTRSSLEQFKSPDSCTQMGMSVRRDKTGVRWSHTNKTLACKNRTPIFLYIRQIPTLSCNTDNTLKRFASERLSYHLCLRKTLYNCILHNESVKINSLSWYFMAQIVCCLHFAHYAKH